MKRRRLGNFLLIIGFAIAAVSIIYYLSISRAQSEMLTAYEEPVIEEKAPMAEHKTTSQALPAASSVTAGEKNTDAKAEYQNGQMAIEIPKLKIKAAVVKGTTKDVLKKGPGLYEGSPLPGEEGGNVCIAGHRTTYGAWFRHVEQLKEGDDIILDYNGSTFSYKVEKVFIVDKKDWSVTEPQGYSVLTLTSCHPIGSSRQRIVVRGRLAE